jgi:L-ascorbate metabolism protein UlaG (beta-lactamase superfamily)
VESKDSRRGDRAHARSGTLLLPAIAVLSALALPAREVAAHRVEVLGFGGYQFGGGLDTEVGRIDISNGGAGGLTVGIVVRLRRPRRGGPQPPGRRAELEPLTVAAPDSALFDLDVHYVQFGGTVQKDYGSVSPFFGMTIGVSIFDPEPAGYSAETRFAGTLSGGAKAYLTPRIGIRGQLRVSASLFSSGTDIFCSLPGACAIRITGNGLVQGDTSAGVFVMFCAGRAGREHIDRNTDASGRPVAREPLAHERPRRQQERGEHRMPSLPPIPLNLPDSPRRRSMPSPSGVTPPVHRPGRLWNRHRSDLRSRIRMLLRRKAPVPPPSAYDQARVILISHAHRDHLSPASISRFPASVTVLCSKESAAYLSGLDLRMEVMEPGEEYAFPGGTIIAVPAKHPGSRWSLDSEPDGRALGFVIRTPAVTLYYSGDSDYFSGFADIGRTYAPDLALININAHLHGENALRAIGDLGAPTVIPLHHGAYRNLSELRSPYWHDELARDLGPRFVRLAVGESFPLSRLAAP